jgi:hypothetical protein
LLPSGTQENINKYIIKPAILHGSRRITGFVEKINVSCEEKTSFSYSLMRRSI